MVCCRTKNMAVSRGIFLVVDFVFHFHDLAARKFMCGESKFLGHRRQNGLSLTVCRWLSQVRVVGGGFCFVPLKKLALDFFSFTTYR